MDKGLISPDPLLLLSDNSILRHPKNHRTSRSAEPGGTYQPGVDPRKKGEPEVAVEEYKKAAKDFPTAYLYLGNIYYGKGEYSVAEKYYRKVIKRKPDLADAYNNLAWMFYRSGTNLNEAEALSQKALELDPSNDNYKDTFKALGEGIKQEGYEELFSK